MPALRIRAALACALLGLTSSVLARDGLNNYVCPDLPAVNADGIGPYDARDPQHYDMRVNNVEKNHWNSDVQTLRAGQTSVWVGADVHYVLHRFPNHPGALRAMLTLTLRAKRNFVPGALKPTPCYFEHAVKFAPDDPDVRLVYGTFLARRNRLDSAAAELLESDRLRPNHAQTLYNLGLVYFEMGDLERSLAYAKRGYAQGYPLPGLKDKLVKAGRWTE